MSFCHYYDQNLCRSCSQLNIPYEEQICAKMEMIQNLLGDCETTRLQPPVCSEIIGFRNKAKMGIFHDHGKIGLGVVTLSETTDLSECPLYHPAIINALSILKAWLSSLAIPPYDLKTQKGELKYLHITYATASQELMLRLVGRSNKVVPLLRQSLPKLQEKLPTLKVITFNIQPIHMAILEGKEEIILSQETMIWENFNTIPLAIRPKSFFQTNPAVTRQLYYHAQQWARKTSAKHIWDLFCGVGGFGLHCTPADGLLTGIEIEEEAIEAAKLSAQKIGLKNTTFIPLDIAQATLETTPDLLIVNPPRRGLGEILCRQISTVRPHHILYSSCNPQTLKNDLLWLSNYTIQSIQLFDMFPHTHHQEVLVTLSLQEAEH